MIATAPARQGTLTSTHSATTEMARVDIGGVGFALPLAAVATVLAPAAMSEAIDDSRWLGTVPSRSGAIPIADGRALFGFEPAEPSAGRLLILRGSPATGLLVDVVLGTATAGANDIEWLSPLFGASERLLTQAVVTHADGALDLIFDLPALRRHLHDGPDEEATAMASATAAIFEEIPSNEFLEARLDDGDERWLLPVACVRQISDLRAPAPLPRAAEPIRGLLAWRGKPIPMIDTTRALGLPSADPATLVVIGPPAAPGGPTDDALLALTVTTILGVAPPDSDARHLNLADLIRRLG